MTSFHKTLLLSVFALFVTPVSATDLSKVNFSHLYQADGIKLDYQVAKKDSLYTLVTKFTYQRITELQTIDSLQLCSQEKFSSKKDFEISIVDRKLTIQPNGELRTYKFRVNPKHNFILIKVYLNNLPYIYEIPINGAVAIAYPDFITLPIHNINISDSLDVVNPSKSQIYGYEYHHDFKVALPPFVIKRSLDSTQKKMSIAQTHLIGTSFTVSESSNTLYLFQSDTNSMKGQRILTHKAGFPKSQTIEELIEPLIFISTKKEADIIASNQDKKKAFEDFWLKNIPDKASAARTIKNYYKRIALANTLFSSFKTGWKTDQGMILTIFGPPTRVSKKLNKEIWEYSTFKGDIKFTFAKQSNIFDHNYYLLERDERLTDVWFNEVKKWRNGDI